MSNFKFGQKDSASKYFYKQKQVTDIFTIDMNNVVVSAGYCTLSNQCGNDHTSFYQYTKEHI